MLHTRSDGKFDDESMVASVALPMLDLYRFLVECMTNLDMIN